MTKPRYSRRTLVLWASFFVMPLFSLPASAAVYKWVDEKGITHYSDDPRRAPEDHQQVDQTMPPVHTMKAPDRKLTQVQKAAQREQRRKAVSSRRSHTDRSTVRCETYKKRLDKVQAQLRRGYREPQGNKLRERRRELAARIKAVCY